MSAGLNTFGRRRVLEMFADWTDRIAAGEVPPAPPRPRGIERNLVITQWDWADPKSYLHDSVSTDRRNPRLNPYGPIYGSLELSSDYVPVLDPVKHTVSRVPLSVRDPNTPPTSPKMPHPSPYWGDEADLDEQEQRAQPDARREEPAVADLGRRAVRESGVLQGRDRRIRPRRRFRCNNASRHLQMYDPQTKKLTHIRTCFATHHLMFAEDANRTLWTSGGGQVIGWLNTKKFDETGDEMASQGWTPLIVDTNGNGRRDAYVEPDQPVDPTKDKPHQLAVLRGVAGAGRIGLGIGARFPWRDHAAGSGIESAGNRADGNLRAAGVDRSEGRRARVLAARHGRRSQRRRVGRRSSSGHMASFDRRKCKSPLNGPKATGQHCREGWTFYAEPLPQMKGVTDVGSAEASYYTWVDQFDTSGLGANTPINTGNASEALLALKDGNWVVMRVPYPTGLLHEVDGRPHRRSGEGLEGQGPVGDDQHAHAVPYGNRQRARRAR